MQLSIRFRVESNSHGRLACIPERCLDFFPSAPRFGIRVAGVNTAIQFASLFGAKFRSFTRFQDAVPDFLDNQDFSATPSLLISSTVAWVMLPVDEPAQYVSTEKFKPRFRPNFIATAF